MLILNRDIENGEYKKGSIKKQETCISATFSKTNVHMVSCDNNDI